jgi:uncharacterized membrane protein YeaQ/YmgE (transglycosylase-associated protein family)
VASAGDDAVPPAGGCGVRNSGDAWHKQSSSFILTILLGIVGAFVATKLGQFMNLYQPNESAGLFGAIIGSVLVLFVWHRLVVTHTINDPGQQRRWL